MFEEGFSEDDPLWSRTERESNGAMDVRSRTVLDDVFQHDSNTWISISSHSGEIGSILRGECCCFIFGGGKKGWMLILHSTGTSTVWFGNWSGHSCAGEGGDR